MSTCACAPDDLRSVAFAHDIVMQWCGRHEVQRWTVDGRQADHADVLPALKDLFVEERGSGRRRGPAAPKVVRLPGTTSYAPPAARAYDLPSDEESTVTDEQLTALLKSRGLQGTWSIG